MQEIITENADETLILGEKVGRLLEMGDCLLLTGDLGSGKTTFTKGIGLGMGISKIINSPTFTIMKIYSGNLNLYHFDFYRLDEKDNDGDFLEYIEGNGVAVIEWPFNAFKLLPENYLIVEITISNETERKFNFKAKGNRYLKLIEEIFL